MLRMLGINPVDTAQSSSRTSGYGQMNTGTSNASSDTFERPLFYKGQAQNSNNISNTINQSLDHTYQNIGNMSATSSKAPIQSNTGTAQQYGAQSSGITPEQEKIRRIIFNTVNNEPLTNLGSGVNMDFTSMFDTGQPDKVKRETLIRNVFKTLNENNQRESFDSSNRGNSEGATPSATASFDLKKLSEMSNRTVAGDESDKDNPSKVLDYLGKSGKQVLLGNYTDDVTALGTVGQVATGFFDLDLPADLRDLTYDLSNWKSTPEHIIQTALDGIGVFPVLGVFKSFDEVAALAKGAKKVDNIFDAAKGTFKNEDVVGNVLDNFIKHDETTEAFISSKKAAEAADAAEDAAWYADEVAKGAGEKIISSAYNVNYGQSSLDKAFSKHSADFGTYFDGSNASKELFKSDINNLLEKGVQKSGTYRATQGTHVYNPSTLQWAFYDSTGNFVTAFLLGPDQFKYLIKTGVVK